eukprot:5910388-Amphidinium_carterae.1
MDGQWSSSVLFTDWASRGLLVLTCACRGRFMQSSIHTAAGRLRRGEERHAFKLHVRWDTLHAVGTLAAPCADPTTQRASQVEVYFKVA